VSELRPRDKRLFELLVATGHLTEGRAAEAMEAFAAAREADADLRLSRFLLEGDVVGPDVIEEFLGAEEDRPRSGAGAASGAARVSGRGAALLGEGALLPGVPARPGPGDEPDEDEDTSSASEPALLPFFSGGPRRGRPAPDEDSAQAVEERARRQASRRRSRALLRRSGGAPATPGETETASFDPNALAAASMGDVDVDTAGFDPALLAEASTRRVSRPAAWLPLAAGCALVALIALLVVAARDDRAETAAETTPSPTESAPSPPPPTPDGPEAGEDEVGDDDGLVDLLEEEGPASEASPAPGDPLADALERASALEGEEHYAAARTVLAALPDDVRVPRREELARMDARLDALEAFRAAADALLAEVADLRAAGRFDEAADRLERFLDDHAEERASATGLRVVNALVELLDAREAARPEAAPPGARERSEPPARIERFAARAEQGQRIVAALEERIAREKARRDEVRRDEARRARESSSRRPLTLELFPGYVVRDAVVMGFDEQGFTLHSPVGEFTYGWDAVDPRVALRIRRLAVRGDVAQDHLRLGLWCLERRMFGQARDAFRGAVDLDPSLIPRVPDVDEVSRAGRVFGGELVRRGSSIEVTYGFDGAEEARDWDDRGDARGVLRGSRLEVRGDRGLFLTALEEVGFDGEVEVEVELGQRARGTAALFGVAFAAGTRAELSYLVGVESDGDVVLLERAGRGGDLRKLDEAPGAAAAALTLEIEDGLVRVRRTGGPSLAQAEASPVWERCRVVLGGATRRPGGIASYESLRIAGRVRYDWLRKALGELDALLRGLLARTDELPVFARPRGRPRPEPLSAEDAFGLEGVGAEALEHYERGVAAAAGREALEQLEAASEFASALELAPGFAAASFRRGLALEAVGRPRLALAELERAIANCPGFYEAHAARARLLARAGQLERAEAEAETALALRPDHAPAHAARGHVRFLRGELELALADLELAVALDPWDDETRARRRNVAHVVRGPGWSRAFRVETEHYVVETNITADRCEEYARELEAIRGYYAQRFGLDPAGAPPRKAKVLIFDTREGFHGYAELTTDDRVESLLGAYLPRYGQLVLYEDRADATRAETRRVLYHEAFHQFIDPFVPDMPYWLNEGLAEYFSACQVEGGRVVHEGGALEDRLRDLRRFVQRRGPFPFGRLMQETPAQFYSGPVAAKYAQAWAMVHFLELAAGDELRERYRRYLDGLLDGAFPAAAFQEAWSGADWEAFREAWVEHVQGL